MEDSNPQPGAGSLILLNGASSAGKSTLAREIQASAEVPMLRFSLDFFFFGEFLPTRRDGLFAWPLMRPGLLRGYDDALAAFLRAGNNLVVDHIFETREMYDHLMAALNGIDIFLVGVHCSLEELERRERARGDRRVGEAKRDLETVHSFCAYDFEVDSTNPPEQNAALILKAWNGRRCGGGEGSQ